jgi:hypothetical protein
MGRISKSLTNSMNVKCLASVDIIGSPFSTAHACGRWARDAAVASIAFGLSFEPISPSIGVEAERFASQFDQMSGYDALESLSIDVGAKSRKVDP